jgi:hypothetical protein
MNSAELKLDLIRKIDKLEKKQLSELSGVVSNMIHGKFGNDDWDLLSQYEKDGIMEAMEDLKNNGGINHENVIKKIRRNIANA